MKKFPQEGKVIFRSGDEVWERDGYCCGCGECCMGDPFNGQEGEPKIEGACPLLDLHGCTNKEHPYYNKACVFFPSHPTQIEDKPSCTYTFRKL